MAAALERGVTENPPWAKETEEYLCRLPPVSRSKWLNRFIEQMQQWDRFQDIVREILKDQWSDCFPWMWEIERRVTDGCLIKERTFDSVDGFLGCLQMPRLEPSTTRIVLICSKHGMNKGLIPIRSKPRKDGGWTQKAYIDGFYWFASVITLALLGSREKIAPETLFPVVGYGNDFWSDDTESSPRILEGEQNVNSLDSLRLPSKRLVARPVSIDYDQIVTEALFLAITFLPPRLDQNFLNFEFYHRPDHHSLRLIKVPRPTSVNEATDLFIVICDSQETRGSLKNHVTSGSLFEDRSLEEPETNSRCNSPISLVRSCKQYVIDELCHNLDCLKINLEEAKYISREDPSYKRLNYVLHLRDHLQMTKRFLDYLAQEFPGLPDSRPLDQADTWPSVFKGDQDYLHSAIQGLENEIEQVYETIKTQIESKNSSRNKLFAVLASLYLPFSLTTGVFGMNIKEINGATPRWSAAVALGLPLAAVTVAMPLCLNYGIRKVAEFPMKHPRLFKFLLRSIFYIRIIYGLAVLVFIIVASRTRKLNSPS